MIMNLAENKTSELWRSFMPQRKEITNFLSTDLFSMQVSKNSTHISLQATIWLRKSVARVFQTNLFHPRAVVKGNKGRPNKM